MRRSAFTPGVVAGALRAIAAILRAAAGLDGQQRAELHLVPAPVLQVNGAAPADQVEERRVVDLLEFGELHERHGQPRYAHAPGSMPDGGAPCYCRAAVGEIRPKSMPAASTNRFCIITSIGFRSVSRGKRIGGINPGVHAGAGSLHLPGTNGERQERTGRGGPQGDSLAATASIRRARSVTSSAPATPCRCRGSRRSWFKATWLMSSAGRMHLAPQSTDSAPRIQVIRVQPYGFPVFRQSLPIAAFFHAQVAQQVVHLRLLRHLGRELGEYFFRNALRPVPGESALAAEAMALHPPETRRASTHRRGGNAPRPPRYPPARKAAGPAATGCNRHPKNESALPRTSLPPG